MAEQFSSSGAGNANVISPHESMFTLVELQHTLLSEPVRLVNDNKFFLFNGEKYFPCAFSIPLPDEQGKKSPGTELQIDNVSHLLSAIIERTNGFSGGKLHMFLALRSQPTIKEQTRTLKAISLKINLQSVVVELGYADLLNKRVVNRFYRQENSPGIF